MIDLKHEMKRELSSLEPPDLWERIEAEASAYGVAAVAEPTAAGYRRPAIWSFVAAGVALVALAATLALSDDEPVDTTAVTEVPVPMPAPTLEPSGTGPVREPSDEVHEMTPTTRAGFSGEFVWEDPLDAAEPWVDLERVAFSPEGQSHWYLELAAHAPSLMDLEPGVVIAFGLVFDADRDGAADYVVGLSNETPARGQFRVWLTDLESGETVEQIGPPYGFPIEFAYAAEETVPPGDEAMSVALTFLGGSAPDDLSTESAPFYAWSSASRDGVVLASDYAPDTGWMSR